MGMGRMSVTVEGRRERRGKAGPAVAGKIGADPEMFCGALFLWSMAAPTCAGQPCGQYALPAQVSPACHTPYRFNGTLRPWSKAAPAYAVSLACHTPFRFNGTLWPWSKTAPTCAGQPRVPYALPVQRNATALEHSRASLRRSALRVVRLTCAGQPRVPYAFPVLRFAVPMEQGRANLRRSALHRCRFIPEKPDSYSALSTPSTFLSSSRTFRCWGHLRSQ